MARPPGMPGDDYLPRVGRAVPPLPQDVCADCGDERLLTDLVTDNRDSDLLCAACAVLRVETTLSPGDVKDLLADASVIIFAKKP